MGIAAKTIRIYVLRGLARNRMEPILQVALDFQHAKRALQAAEEAVAGGADWVEGGTPLIKSEGVEVIRALKRKFPNKTIVADLKIADTGALEVEIATKAGADVVTVMAVTDDGTMREAIKAARRYGAKIMADMMAVQDMPKRTKELQEMGADYICVHVSIDEQMIAHTPLQRLKEVCQVAEIPVAVAGGLNSETVADAIAAGATIIIVGGAIIKAEKVTEATRKVKEAITKHKKVRTDLYKKYGEEDLAEAFMKVSTPNISDAFQKRGTMHGIAPRMRGNIKMVGRALTVKTADGDWAKPVEAIDRAKKGTPSSSTLVAARRRCGESSRHGRARSKASRASSSTAQSGTSTRFWTWGSRRFRRRSCLWRASPRGTARSARRSSAADRRSGRGTG